MKSYIFFTKTLWCEPPRLRQQLASLLGENGNEVLFFEKPLPFGRRVKSIAKKPPLPWLRTLRTNELIHHQLRFWPFLRCINSLYEKRQIKKHLIGIGNSEIIINFNYDYCFLRELFPNSKIITIINDDFVAQSKFLHGSHALKALEKTCSISDNVLVVSYSIAKQVMEWCNPMLFFPWADVPYEPPKFVDKRDSVLVWAHIDRRLDFDLLRKLAEQRPNYTFHIVGPVSKNVVRDVKNLQLAYSNLKILEAAKINELPHHEYFCSLIPYKSGQRDVEAVTVSNKAFQLLARGLPLVTHGMPNFLVHPAILKTGSAEGALVALDFCNQNFCDLQESISDIVAENQSENRLIYFLDIIERDSEEG